MWLRGRDSNHIGQDRDVKSFHSARDTEVKSICWFRGINTGRSISSLQPPRPRILKLCSFSFLFHLSSFCFQRLKKQTWEATAGTFRVSEWAGQKKQQTKIIFLQCSTPARERWWSAEDSLTAQLSLLKGTSIRCFLIGRIALPPGHSAVLLQLTQSSCGCHVWKTGKLRIPCSKSGFYLVLPAVVHEASSGMWPWELPHTAVLFAGCLPLVTTAWSLCFPHWSRESLARPWNSSSAFTATKNHKSWSKPRFIQKEGLNPIRAK